MSVSTFRSICAGALAVTLSIPAFSIGFGTKAKDATVKVVNGKPLKGKSTLAIGAFRVAFKTHDQVVSIAHGALMGNGGSSVTDDTTLSGVDHALMQKIADEIYADFLVQAKAKGYSITDSAALASTSADYKALPVTASFAEGPFGLFVVPTGQTSPVLGADDYKQERHGAQSFTSGFKGIGVGMAKTAANDVFIKVASPDTAVLAVTIVVNYATYKGTQSQWGGSSSATVDFGATIEGADAYGLGTGVKAWDSKTQGCAACMAQANMSGNIHTSDSIGTTEKRDALGVSGNVSNALGALMGTGVGKHKAFNVTADPVAYEKNVLVVASEASNLMLTKVAAER